MNAMLQQLSPRTVITKFEKIAAASTELITTDGRVTGVRCRRLSGVPQVLHRVLSKAGAKPWIYYPPVGRKLYGSRSVKVRLAARGCSTTAVRLMTLRISTFSPPICTMKLAWPIQVTIMSPMMTRQRLTDDEIKELQSGRPQMLRELAEKLGRKPIHIALAYVLAQPFPVVPLIGPRNVAELEDSRRRLVEAEVKTLRAQISPHFVYNALTTIASFIRTDPVRARELLGMGNTLVAGDSQPGAPTSEY